MRGNPCGLLLACLLPALLVLSIPGTAGAAQIGEQGAVRAANHDPKVVEEWGKNGGLTHSASMVDGNWEVAYFASEEEVALVIVDPATGLVRESWTGYQVLWKMARG